MAKMSFIIPLRSANTTQRWERVSSDCVNTIDSILQQTDQDFDIILVCNQEPQGLKHNDKIRIFIVDYPTPNNIKEMRKDQRNKIKKALIEIRKSEEVDGKFLMRVDADDFVSKHLVYFVKENSKANGFYFFWGYLFQESCDYVFLQPRFYRVSGTSAIVKLSKQDYPLTEDDPNNGWVNNFWSHQRVVSEMKKKGTPLARLPFIGAAYQFSTGENISKNNLHISWKGGLKKILKNLIFRRKISIKIIQEFGINKELTNLS